jgi:catechol 2,3-dioxygenase-like lactoylglutathione lyase family enzyme
MGLPNGLHHLALATRDLRGQLDFFTEVVGMELLALYWMHGVPGAMHAFLRLGDTASLAFVAAPSIDAVEPQLGVTHAGSPGGPVAGGAMQHVALNVDGRDALLALRDRIRTHGHRIFGPVDHGMCQSMYMMAPEGIVLEFSTSASPIDPAQWIDPEVVARCGIDDATLARYRAPAAFASRGGTVAQPPATAAPAPLTAREMAYLLGLSDADVTARLDFPTPPVPPGAA